MDEQTEDLDIRGELDDLVKEMKKPINMPTQEKLIPRHVGAMPVPPAADVSLTAKLGAIDRANRALRQDLDNQRMELHAEHDRKWTETQHEFARKIHEETVKLENARDEALQKLSDDYFSRKRELDFIASRLG